MWGQRNSNSVGLIISVRSSNNLTLLAAYQKFATRVDSIIQDNHVWRISYYCSHQNSHKISNTNHALVPGLVQYGLPFPRSFLPWSSIPTVLVHDCWSSSVWVVAHHLEQFSWRYMGPGHHLYLPHTPSKKPRLPEELHYRIVSQPVLGSRLPKLPINIMVSRCLHMRTWQRRTWGQTDKNKADST